MSFVFAIMFSSVKVGLGQCFFLGGWESRLEVAWSGLVLHFVLQSPPDWSSTFLGGLPLKEMMSQSTTPIQGLGCYSFSLATLAGLSLQVFFVADTGGGVFPWAPVWKGRSWVTGLCEVRQISLV